MTTDRAEDRASAAGYNWVRPASNRDRTVLVDEAGTHLAEVVTDALAYTWRARVYSSDRQGRLFQSPEEGQAWVETHF